MRLFVEKLVHIKISIDIIISTCFIDVFCLILTLDLLNTYIEMFINDKNYQNNTQYIFFSCFFIFGTLRQKTKMTIASPPIKTFD